MNIIIAILMLCVIVVAHELGHMLVAKANHIEVKEFWVGFGPKICGFEAGGTKYSLRIIPLGGACVFDDPEELEEADGMNTEAPEKTPLIRYDKRGHQLKNYREAGVWARIATLFAGPVFNFIFAFLMGLIVMSFSYMPSSKVVSVTEDSPAMEAGLEAGDDIVRINGSRVYLYPEVSLAIQTGVGSPLSVEYKRDGQTYKTEIIPEMNDEYGYYMIGVSFGGDEEANTTPISVVTGSYKYVRYMVKMTYLSFKMLLNGQASAKDLSGAVGIVSVVSDEYEAASAISPLAVFVSMLNIAVLISANLGVVNLLPFPALDGGKIILGFYEVITGRKVNEKVEGFINLIGMVLLMMLFVFTMFNDVFKLLGM